jgi:hypothetical protein
MIRQVVLLGLSLALPLSFAGCGGAPGDVKLVKAGGVVTFLGQPLGNATVTFVPDSGPIAMGTADKDGKFTLSTGSKPGVVVGKCRVSVSVNFGYGDEDELKNLSPSERNEKLTLKMGEKTGEYGKGKQPDLLPSRFADVRTSGLEFTVTDNPDKNVFDLKL